MTVLDIWLEHIRVRAILNQLRKYNEMFALKKQINCMKSDYCHNHGFYWTYTLD